MYSNITTGGMYPYKHCSEPLKSPKSKINGASEWRYDFNTRSHIWSFESSRNQRFLSSFQQAENCDWFAY